MQNRKWARLSDAEKGQLVSIWILAADRDGQVPNDAFLLKKICMLDTEPSLDKFIELGLLTPTGRQRDVNVTSARRQSDAPEAEPDIRGDKKEPYGSSGEQDSPAAYSVPLTKGKFHHVTADDLAHYRKTYPAVDVDQSLRNILEWLELNKRKRSGTVKGSKQRIATWLAKDQDKASKTKPQDPTAPDQEDRRRESEYFLRGAV